MTMKLTIPYPPTLNHLYATVRGRRVLSREGRAFKERVGVLAMQMNPVGGSLKLSVDVYRPRKSGDLDNTLKATMDSLTGCVWHDDSQVCEIVARRFDDKANPRIELTIEQM